MTEDAILPDEFAEAQEFLRMGSVPPFDRAYESLRAIIHEMLQGEPIDDACYAAAWVKEDVEAAIKAYPKLTIVFRRAHGRGYLSLKRELRDKEITAAYRGCLELRLRHLEAGTWFSTRPKETVAHEFSFDALFGPVAAAPVDDKPSF